MPKRVSLVNTCVLTKEVFRFRVSGVREPKTKFRNNENMRSMLHLSNKVSKLATEGLTPET
jgi:hypothetical protein